MSKEIVIVSCGIISPVGFSARETAASARSRTARLTAIEWRDSRFQEFKVGIVPDEGLYPIHPEFEDRPLTFRESRMLRLAHPALEEALTALPRGVGAIPLLLALPELHTTIPIQPPALLARLRTVSGAPILPETSVAFPVGRAGALLCLAEAIKRLEAGGCPFVLVGGVDSQVDLYILGTLDMQKRVRTEVNADGFAPGEGAGFVLLTTRETAAKYHLPPLASLLATGTAKESGHIYSEEPYKGEGLAAAFENLFAAAPDAPPVGCIYASFNGEHYWAKEFGVAMVRHREHFEENHLMEHPAECFGDLGAAHGAVMLALAALWSKRTCSKTSAMIFASSDFGDRGAALLVQTQ